MSEWEVELQVDGFTWFRARLAADGLYEVQIERANQEYTESQEAKLNRSQLAILTDSMQRAAGVMM